MGDSEFIQRSDYKDSLQQAYEDGDTILLKVFTEYEFAIIRDLMFEAGNMRCCVDEGIGSETLENDYLIAIHNFINIFRLRRK